MCSRSIAPYQILQHLHVGYVRAGIPEVRRVRGIQGLRTEVEREALVEPERADHARIQIDHSWTAQYVEARGSKTGRGYRREGERIKPAVDLSEFLHFGLNLIGLLADIGGVERSAGRRN